MTLPAIASSAHDSCLQAADYEGCMRVKQNGGVATSSNNSLSNLRAAMKQVSSRLSSGTSLRDSSLTFQPVIDAHAVVSAGNQNTFTYQAATLAIDLFNKTKKNWQDRISYTSYSGGDSYILSIFCEKFDRQVSAFNRAVGKQAIKFKWKKRGLLGVCHRQTAYPEALMYNFTIGVLRDGSTDPAVMKAYQAKRAEAIRVANLGPWQRHLEKNPDLKVWAEANTSAAVKAQEKFNRDNPSDPINLPPLPSTLPYLQGSILEDSITDFKE